MENEAEILKELQDISRDIRLSLIAIIGILIGVFLLYFLLMQGLTIHVALF